MTDHKTIANEVADQIGETGAPGQAPRARVEQQIARMQKAIGDDGWWLRTTANVACAAHEMRPSLRADGTQRTKGGAFFEHARRQAFEMVKLGQMPRKTFYAAFCWREPTPKVKKAPPVKKPLPKHTQKPPPRQQQKRGRAPVEVVHVRTSQRGKS